MTENHPITPPPELVEQWMQEASGQPPGPDARVIATQAARWGTDMELEACCEWLRVHHFDNIANDLLAARRPKPSSLKERALQAWAAIEAGTDNQTAMAVIRRALEQLDG